MERELRGGVIHKVCFRKTQFVQKAGLQPTSGAWSTPRITSYFQPPDTVFLEQLAASEDILCDMPLILGETPPKIAFFIGSAPKSPEVS